MATSIPTLEPRQEPAIAAPRSNHAASSRGAHGSVTLVAECVGGRTRLTTARCEAPLQVLRAHYLDAALPDMAFVTLANASGGVLQGDRLEIDLRVARGARVHLDTQSATRLYRAPAFPSRCDTRLSVDEGAYLEYLPDPWLPFAGSHLTSTITCRIAAGGALVMTEVVAPGRVALGEVHRFTRFETRTLVVDASGRTIAADSLVLDSADDLGSPGHMGGFVALGSVVVVAAGFDVGLLRQAASTAQAREGDEVWAGASTLPNGVGGWLKVLARTARAAVRVTDLAASDARQTLLGAPLPASRRP